MQNALHLISETKKYPISQIENVQSNVAWINDRKLINEINLKMAKLLIDAGCDMNHRDYHSHETPAFRAIVTNNYELVKLFIVEGLDMSVRNLFGNDVLSRSIQLGRFRIARLLIAAHSPIRVYSCFFKIPSFDELNRSRENHEMIDYGDEEYYTESNQLLINNENFLQYSLSKYEEFLKYIQTYTQEPRSLKDLARLGVRNQMKKPISKSMSQLGILPKEIQDLIMLYDIDRMASNI
jgi:ankyrin repeat protein